MRRIERRWGDYRYSEKSLWFNLVSNWPFTSINTEPLTLRVVAVYSSFRKHRVPGSVGSHTSGEQATSTHALNVHPLPTPITSSSLPLCARAHVILYLRLRSAAFGHCWILITGKCESHPLLLFVAVSNLILPTPSDRTVTITSRRHYFRYSYSATK